MDSLRLSIIIPFYNVEKYITECLDSVYNQDIPENEYEVICVNDGSLDQSRGVVINYMQQHSNLIMVEHEHNKKLGTARNTGRKAARGKYIWNVDSDDRLKPNCLSHILSVCEENVLDVFLFCYDSLIDNEININHFESWPGYNIVKSGYEFWKDNAIPNQGRISQVWTQVYRKEYLDKHNIWSPEINMGEDVPYTYSALLLSDRLMAVNDSYYVWRDNSDSLTGVLKRIPKPETVYENSFVCGKAVFELKEKVAHAECEIRQSIIQTSRYIVVLYAEFYNRMEPIERKEFSHLLRIHFFENLYLLRILNRKQLLKYLLLVCK